jgi:hypothetical protein
MSIVEFKGVTFELDEAEKIAGIEMTWATPLKLF